ncbi:MAG: SRPBCC family protein [Rhodocyclaceae bacterium]
MSVIDESVLINASRELVFAMSQNAAARDSWDPFTRCIDYEGGAGPHLGAVARVLARNGLAMQVRYIKFEPPARAAIVMLQGPAFLTSFAGSWIFESVSARQTRVRFRYSLTAWPLLEQLCVWRYRRDVRRRLQGLQSYCDSLTTHAGSATDPCVQPCAGERS